MARIPESEIERLKREIALERLVEARGVKLARHGAELIGLCPFHDDREPSLVVNPQKNLWHCLGACQTGGSVIDWVMRSNGVSFRHAVELLRADVPLSATGSTVRQLPPPVERAADDGALLKQVAGFYHETLKQSPEALEYLAKRGLESPEMIDRFQLGFANRTLGLRLPAKNRQAGAEMRGRLQSLVSTCAGSNIFSPLSCRFNIRRYPVGPPEYCGGAAPRPPTHTGVSSPSSPSC